MKKKFLCIMLVLMMLFTSIPALSFAGEVVKAYPDDPNYTYVKWTVSDGAMNTGLPYIIDDSIVAVGNKELIWIDKETGKVTTKTNLTGNPSYGGYAIQPTYDETNGMLYIPLNQGVIEKVNVHTQKSVGTFTESELKGQCISKILYDNGYLYVGFWNQEEKDAKFCCIDASTMKEKWSYKHKGGFYWAEATAIGNYIVVGSDDGSPEKEQADGTVYVFNKSNANPVQPVSSLKITGSGDIRSKMVYDGVSDRIYFTGKGGKLMSLAFDSSTGALSDLKTLNMESASTCTPVIYDDYIFVGTTASKKLLIVDKDTLTLKAFTVLNGGVQETPLVVDYYKDSLGYLYIYETYNANPGGISLIKINLSAMASAATNTDLKGQPSVASVTDIYEANGYENYCLAPVIDDNQGNLYYKNDSGYIFAIAKSDSLVPRFSKNITTATAKYDIGTAASALVVEVASASDIQNLAYQWQRKTGSVWEDIPAATATSLTPNTKTPITTSYRCKVTFSIAGKTFETYSNTIKVTGSGKYQVYVTISDKGNIVTGKSNAVAARYLLSVTDTNKDGKINVDEVLTQLHTKIHTSGKNAYASSVSDWGLSIKKLWNDTSGWFGYYVNNESALSLDDEVPNGGNVVAFIYKDQAFGSDKYTFFTQDAVSVTENENVTLTLNYSGYDDDWNPVVGPYTGSAKVKILGDNNTSLKPYTTNASGNVTLKFSKAGTYKVVAYKDDGSIVPAVCEITVGAGTPGPTPSTPKNEVYFTLKGDTKHEGLHQGTSYPTWISRTTVPYTDGMTVGNVFKTVLDGNANVSYDAAELAAGYIASITYKGTTLSEFDNGVNSGWMYTVNGVYPNVGLNNYVLADGDEIVWQYVDDYQDIPESQYAGSGSFNKDDKKVTEAAIKAPFVDIAESDWYYAAVTSAYALKMVDGVDATHFAPKSTFTRGMMVTMLYKLEGKPAATGANPFADVKSGDWYEDAIKWAYANKVVDGVDTTHFDPLADITREQMAAMLYKYAKYKNLDLSKVSNLSGYTDTNKIADWALDAFKWANGNAVLNGFDGLLTPKSTATRAEAAQMLVNFVEKVK